MSASGWWLLTAVTAALAAAVLLPGRSRLTRGPSGHDARAGGPAAIPVVAGTVLLAAVAVLAVPPGWWPPSALLGAAGLAGWSLWRRRRERQARADTQRHVLDLCDHLAGDLGAGQPPGVALARAATSWSSLGPVAEAFRVGADVPAALRVLSTAPGAGDLRLLAAAWQVAHRTGQGLAAAVDRVGRQLVESRSTRRVVDGELASARATARLVAALPVAALAMGSGIGGDPLGFLLGRPAGWVCLAAGLLLGLSGLAWIEALARDVDRQS